MKIQDFIICDDVREEINAKITLVGTYVDKLVYGFTKEKPIEWPIKARAFSYVKFKLDKEGEADSLKFFFLDKGGNKTYHEQTLEVKDEKLLNAKNSGVFIVRFPTLELVENSTIDLKVEVLKGGEVIEVVESDSRYRVETREVK